MDRRPDTDRASLTLHEEVAVARTERVATERVVLRKRVVTEDQTVTVQVRREIAELVRLPLDGQVHEGDVVLDDETAVPELVLRAERPVVGVEVVDVERVRLVKEVVREQREVVVDLGREVAEVDHGGLTDRVRGDHR